MKPEPKDLDKKDCRDREDKGVEQDESAPREIDPEFQRIAKENLRRYRPAMKELAK